MTIKPRFVAPNTDELPKEMVELATAIATLPPEHRMQLDGVFQRVVDSTKRRRRILHLVQEALGQLRLDMKYLMFDLEATRRERDVYRQQLEGDNSADNEDQQQE